jgi:hypothetical protein
VYVGFIGGLIGFAFFGKKAAGLVLRVLSGWFAFILGTLFDWQDF